MAETLEDTLRRGWSEQQAGRLQEAERAYRAVLAANPNDPSALHLLGTIALQVNQPQVAADLIGRAIGIRPEVVAFHLDLGAAKIALGKRDAALSAFQRAAELATHSVHFRAAAKGLFTLGKPADAAAAYQSAIASAPDDSTAYAELGRLLLVTGQAAAAIHELRQASLRNPLDPVIHKDLGMALAVTDRPAEAEKYLRTAIAALPNDAYILNALGSALGKQNKVAESIACFDKAISLLPPGKEPSFHWNLGRVLMLLGQFERGWRECEWRLSFADLRLKRDFKQPHWSGEDLAGKTILLHAEGGHGDCIQFIRYLPQITARGGTVLLECHPALVRLFEKEPGLQGIYARGNALPPCDFQLPLNSLPFALGTTLDTIPATVPYLQIAPDLVERWRARLAGDSGFKIGLVWCGSDTVQDQRTRKPSAFAPLANVGAVTFYSLQKGPAAAEPAPAGMRIVSLDPEIDDFADVAAAILNLDLVITVDTAVAHLAGALGVPVWVLITYNPDFRWMLDREDSPWYPTMRLFRQSKPWVWTDVFERVRSDLIRLACTQDRPIEA